MATKKSNDCPLEGYEQQRFCKWLDDNDILYFAIPNGGYRKKETAKVMQYRGVKKGVPDLFICETKPAKTYYDEDDSFVIDYNGTHGLFIEMKRQKRSYPTIDQKIWIKKLQEKCYRAEVAHGCDEAIAITKAYLGWEEE